MRFWLEVWKGKKAWMRLLLWAGWLESKKKERVLDSVRGDERA